MNPRWIHNKTNRKQSTARPRAYFMGCIRRTDSRFAPSQWETVLLCNDVSHWLGVSIGSALMCLYSIMSYSGWYLNWKENVSNDYIPLWIRWSENTLSSFRGQRSLALGEESRSTCSQRGQDAITTSFLRQNDVVLTYNDVIIASCAHWVAVLFICLQKRQWKCLN